jgi:alpha-pyrone synthase
MNTAYVNRIATAVPAYDVHDTFVRFADSLLENPRHQGLFRRMADRSEIHHRYSTLAPAADPGGAAIDAAAIFARGRFPSSGVRMGLYEQAALPLALEAVGRLEIADRGDAISHLIVTTCTGFYAPGLDMQIAAALGLRSSVERSMVAFMGCYGAFNALKLARRIVRSEPDAQVLVVNLELCTLHLQETQDLEKVLSFLVFADGCAASLVTSDAEGLSLDRFRAALIPASEKLITWRVGDQGFDMHLSGRVPATIAEGLAAAAPMILDGLAVEAIDLGAARWASAPASSPRQWSSRPCNAEFRPRRTAGRARPGPSCLGRGGFKMRVCPRFDVDQSGRSVWNSAPDLPPQAQNDLLKLSFVIE